MPPPPPGSLDASYPPAHKCKRTLRICMISPISRADAALLLTAAPAAGAAPPAAAAAAAILVFMATRSCSVRSLRSAAYSWDCRRLSAQRNVTCR